MYDSTGGINTTEKKSETKIFQQNDQLIGRITKTHNLFSGIDNNTVLFTYDEKMPIPDEPDRIVLKYIKYQDLKDCGTFIPPFDPTILT